MSATTLSNVTNDSLIAFTIAYERQKSVCNRENALLANIVKQGKAEGIPTKAAVEASQKMKAMGEGAADHLRDMIRVMALRNIPVTQPGLFDGWDLSLTQATREEDSAWRAESRGFDAGLHGADVSDNPFAPSTEVHVRWEIGRRNGLATRERNTGGKAVTAPRRRPVRQLRMPGTEPRQDSPALAAKKAAKEANGEAQEAPQAVETEAAPSIAAAAMAALTGSQEAAAEAPVKRGPGRPKGSKNKPKTGRRRKRSRRSRSTPRLVAAAPPA